MNPRNRDARRLRAVRRPHSLILTPSIRPSSKSNDDTSSFRCGSRLVFSVPSPERNVDIPAPEPPSPDTKVRSILPHLSTSTACLTLPAVGDGHVQSPAEPAWLHLVQAHKQQLFCLSRLVPERSGAWWDPTVVGLRQGKYTWRLLWRGLLFCPSLPAAHVLHDHEEDADPDRVVATESLEMNSLLPYFFMVPGTTSGWSWAARGVRQEGRTEQVRTGQRRGLRYWLCCKVFDCVTICCWLCFSRGSLVHD